MIKNSIGKYLFKFFLFSLAVLSGCGLSDKRSKENDTGTAGHPHHPKILFICVDDLRPELGSYRNNYIHSPNLDKLTSEGCLFTHHYAQVPTCVASRLSLLTGMLPENMGQISDSAIETKISGQPEKEMPETFIHHLKRNGYNTVGIGKISHHPDGLLYGYNDPVVSDLELPYSWHEMLLNTGKWETRWNAFFGYADGTNWQGRNFQVKLYENGNVDDDGYPDGLTANLAVEKLGELAKKGQPFFLGVGFFKPHLPFSSPKKYWDMYNEPELPLTPSSDIPKNVNSASLHESLELNRYQGEEKNASLTKPISNAYARKLRHAYFAAISYIDAQIGKVLDELEKQGFVENTILVVWGDHGWHLGDQRIWGKEVIFERALKSPLIIKNTKTKKKGLTISKVASSIDIYPTLMELCGVEMPQEIDGKSLAALLENPYFTGWEGISYSYYLKGISMRTDRYRLTKYFRQEEPVIELYDHQTDLYENRNIADKNADIIEQLIPFWENGNTGLYTQ